MNRLGCGIVLLAIGWLDDTAWAVVPPSTALETPPAHLSPVDWLVYGSVVIVLVALAIAAIVLLTWLIRALFARR